MDKLESLRAELADLLLRRDACDAEGRIRRIQEDIAWREHNEFLRSLPPGSG